MQSDELDRKITQDERGIQQRDRNAEEKPFLIC